MIRLMRVICDGSRGRHGFVDRLKFIELSGSRNRRGCAFEIDLHQTAACALVLEAGQVAAKKVLILAGNFVSRRKFADAFKR